MFDWLIAPAYAVANAAAAVDLNEVPSTWGVIFANLFAALPPTIAAIAALIVSWRNSAKSDSLVKKADDAAVKVEHAVNMAAEKTAMLEQAARAVKDAEQEVHRVVDITEARLSTATEDAKRTAEAVERVLTCIREARDEIITAVEANRPTKAQIIRAKDDGK